MSDKIDFEEFATQLSRQVHAEALVNQANQNISETLRVAANELEKQGVIIDKMVITVERKGVDADVVFEVSYGLKLTGG